MRKILAAAVCLIGVAAAMAQDSSTKPAAPIASQPTSSAASGGDLFFLSLSKCPVGTKIIYETAGEEGGQAIKIEKYIELVEIADEYVGAIEGRNDIDKPKKSRVMKIEKFPSRPYEQSRQLASATIEEDLTINGKTYKCKVIEEEMTPTFKVKRWYCPDVPGLIVKQTTESTEGGISSVKSTTLKSIESGTGIAKSQPATTSAPTSATAEK